MYKKYKITCGPAKHPRNLLIRGLSFDLVMQFDWHGALIRRDERHDYGELRYCALGYIHHRLFSLTFTPRDGAVHVISLRKANPREVSCYEKAFENITDRSG